MGAFYVVQLAASSYPISELFNSREDAEKALPAIAIRVMSDHKQSGQEGYETPAVEVAEFVPTRKPHPREWYWLRDEMAAHIGRDAPGTAYTEHEIRSAIARQSWGAGKGLTPVTPASKDQAFRSLFVQVGSEREPLLVLDNGQITRTAQTPRYFD